MVGLSQEARRLLLVQLVLALVLAALYAGLHSMAGGLAAAWGGTIALLNAALMALVVRRATEVARAQPGAETGVLYMGALGRFALVAVLFAVGLGVLKLLPVPVIVGFAVVHGAFFLARTLVVAPAAGTSRDS